MATENSTTPSDPAAALDKPAPLAYGPTMREKTVTIEVGHEKTQYFVHPSILAYHSEYFKRALNGPWKEADERLIKLDDVECETFDIFLEWLYTQQYPKDDCFERIHSNLCHNQMLRLKTCAFGDRFMVPGFATASEMALVDKLVVEDCPPMYEAITYAFEHLPTGSLVLQVLIDQHCYGFREDTDSEENGELARRAMLPHDFLVGVMLRYMSLQPVKHGERKRPSRCDYHKHGPGDGVGANCTVPRIDDFITI